MSSIRNDLLQNRHVTDIALRDTGCAFPQYKQTIVIRSSFAALYSGSAIAIPKHEVSIDHGDITSLSLHWVSRNRRGQAAGAIDQRRRGLRRRLLDRVRPDRNMPAEDRPLVHYQLARF
jgi:hypothetical protein